MGVATRGGNPSVLEHPNCCKIDASLVQGITKKVQVSLKKTHIVEYYVCRKDKAIMV